MDTEHYLPFHSKCKRGNVCGRAILFKEMSCLFLLNERFAVQDYIEIFIGGFIWTFVKSALSPERLLGHDLTVASEKGWNHPNPSAACNQTSM